MMRINCVIACLKGNNAKQSDSHQNQCIRSYAIVLDELLKAILALEDFLLVLARKNHLLAVVLAVQSVLMVEVQLFHLFNDLDDVVSQS